MLSNYPDAQLKLKNDKCMRTIFYLSNAAGMGEVGIEAEKILENNQVIGSPSKGVVDTMVTRLKERKKALAARRREKAMNAMKNLSASKSPDSTPTTSTTTTATNTTTTTMPTGPPKSSPMAPMATPAWMLAEMEGMEEDDPVVCCVCGEGYR